MTTGTDLIGPGTGALLGARYRLLDRIGRGGMSDVFRARDERLGRDVAVKVLRDDGESESLLRRVRSEATMLATVNHPALVTLHDAATDDGGPLYLVMELVEGCSLAEEPITPADLACVCADVAAALDHAHRSGIIHRDVKPANVLVQRSGDRVSGKLTDLGIAIVAGSTRITAAGTIMGTAAYLSPEQVRGDDVTPATDIYSLGLVMVEGLTGARAYPGTAGESLSARLSRQPVLPEGLDPGDAALLLAMTAIRPEDRPDAAAVERALRSWSTEHVAIAATGLEAAALTTSVGDTLAAGDRTRALPVGDADATTVPVATRGRRPFSRKAVWIGSAVAVVAVTGATTSALVVGAGSPEPLPTRSYPAVEGEIGDHLERLQELVQQ